MEQIKKHNNSLFTVFMYFDGPLLMFNYEPLQVFREQMVMNADKLLIEAAKKKGIENWKEGFYVTFSSTYFPDHDACANWISTDDSDVGDWYELFKQHAWLCPCLRQFYPEAAPLHLYIKVSPKS